MPGIVAFSVGFFCIKQAVSGFHHWFPSYLQEQDKFDKATALNMFSYYFSGSFIGNGLIGFLSDVTPIRSPVFLIGILTSAALVFELTSLTSETGISLVCFLLGIFIFGSTNVITALYSDVGNYVKRKHKVNALGTFSGIINGFGTFGSVVS